MSDEIPPVLDEDYEEAREAVAKMTEESGQVTPPEVLEVLARRCAFSGRRMFQLLNGLYPPRHAFEDLFLRGYRDEITEEEHRIELERLIERPVDLEILRGYVEDFEHYLVWYSKLLQLPYLANRSLDESEVERRAERYIFELYRRPSLTISKLMQVGEFLEEARVEKNLGLAQIGEYSASHVSALISLVAYRASEIWKSCAREALNSQTQPQYLYSTSTVKLFEPRVSAKFPMASDLRAKLREEFAIGRTILQARSNPPSPTHVIENHNQFSPEIHLNPIIEIKEVKSSTTSGMKAKPKEPAQPKYEAKCKPNLENWAVGMELTGKWYLFHKTGGIWKHPRSLKIPAGQPELLMELLANQDGAISKSEALNLLRPQYPGASAAKISRAVTEALRKARKAIRVAIAKAADCDVDDVKNPIPLVKPGWRSIIHIGLATQNDNNDLVFKRKHEMNS